MTRRVLVAGVGNVFFGDDGFGVEVARRMSEEALPPHVEVRDFGIRAMHLAFDLLCIPELLVVVDATTRRGPAGTLYVIDPDVDEEPEPTPTPDAHVMNPHHVLATLRALGGAPPRTRIVGCEPASLEGVMTLSDPVRAAIDPAIAIVRRIIESEVPA